MKSLVLFFGGLKESLYFSSEITKEEDTFLYGRFTLKNPFGGFSVVAITPALGGQHSPPAPKTDVISHFCGYNQMEHSFIEAGNFGLINIQLDHKKMQLLPLCPQSSYFYQLWRSEDCNKKKTLMILRKNFPEWIISLR